MELCDHCALAVGRFGLTRDSAGEDRNFCCYGCFVAWQAAHGGGEDCVAAAFLIRIGVGAFLTMNIMLFSLFSYSASFQELHSQAQSYFHWLLFALATPAVIILGSPFFKESAAGLRRGQLVPSILIAIGSLAAYGYSTIATLQGSDRVYFDTAAMVLLLFTLGRYLEANARARSARSLRPVLEAQKMMVTHVLEEEEVRTPLADIKPGMLVRVAPGQRIPVDGIVKAGESQADESTLTGEPHPVNKGPGSSVVAGSVNGDQSLLVEALVAGLDSQWLTICSEVRDALSVPIKSQVLAEKVTVAFIPLVMLLACFAVWLNRDSMDHSSALLAGLAVLVVACPCALGLASPLATTLAVSRLLERGIVVRNGAALETLASIRTMAMDKTGTLTTNHITCSDVINSDPAISSDEVLQRAAAVVHESRHPLSQAILRSLDEGGISSCREYQVENFPGKGLLGRDDGDAVYVGNERWFKELGIPIVHTVVDATQAASELGRMLAFVAWDSVCRTALVFDVQSHPDAKRVIEALAQDHIEVIVVTGDGKTQTGVFCRMIGVSEWMAELTPENKKQILLELAKDRGPVAMVGDGVNDTQAMIVADVSIAVGNATPIARETADVVLHTDSLSHLLLLLKIARKTQKAIVTNLCWAFGYNGVAILLAVSGILQPIAAAALMAGSSIVVVVNTMRNLSPENCAEDTPSGHVPMLS